jgi:hypothetical protein
MNTVLWLTRQLERSMTHLEACLIVSSLEHDDVLDTSRANLYQLLHLALEQSAIVPMSHCSLEQAGVK